MKLLESAVEYASYESNAVLTIGVFDAIHLGHREIISRCVALAKGRKLPSVVLTFDRNPREVVSGRAPCLITSRPKKVELIESIGADYLIVERFDRDYARMSPGDFCSKVVGGQLHASLVVIGENFHFGAGGRGDSGVLAGEGRRLGFEVDVVPLVTDGMRTLSSTLIREMISRGNVEDAMAGLGRPYAMTGRVVGGHARGKALGFPTANISMENGYCLPADGVYAGITHLRDDQYVSAINIGDNPTFGDTETAVEAYLLDFKGEIYGETLRVEFHHRLREEITFSSEAELVEQLRKDVEDVRVLMQSRSST